MQFLRLLEISTAKSRTASRWKLETLTWPDFCARLAACMDANRGSETHAEYLAMPRDRQANRKDVGGFVGGALRDGVRKHGCCTARSLITLDLDNCAPGSTGAWLDAAAGLGCAAAVYSTRRHDPEHPRLRVVIPTDRDLSPDEYQPAARMLAQMIDPTMEVWDPTTFEAERLMYWPSCSADSETVLHCETGAAPLSADELLGWYADWHDFSQWPRCPGETARERRGAKQADPTAKEGIVGAFCRAYDVPAAIETFLPEVYAPAGEGRYTYLPGSTTGGAVVYDGGKYLYSHHATDPAGGQLLNAWDLVRLHKFGPLDAEAPADAAPGELESWRAMRALAENDPKAGALLETERRDKALEDFTVEEMPAETAPAESADNWRDGLARGSKGQLLNTVENARLILEHDERLAGRIWLDTFAGRMRCQGPLPWPGGTAGERDWTDADDAGARWYMETVYHLTGAGKVQDAVTVTANNHAKDPLLDYLGGLVWDGVERLDTLFIDYLGAEDTPYTRAVTRKMFVAAVRRAYLPGCKFDQICILSGVQGIGKDTLLARMGRQWFNDSITSFENKDAREALRGVWIVELGEMSAFNKSEVEAAKQFLSQTEDRYRAAYGRHTMTWPRRCVFFGTSNVDSYLRDATGNRRYWPVDCEKQDPANTRKNVYHDLTPDVVDQLWAEAVVRHRAGEELILTGQLARDAIDQQAAHREAETWEGQIAQWLDKPVPLDWDGWDIERRRLWWQGDYLDADKVETRPRDKVCIAEVWAECFGQGARIEVKDSRRIGSILSCLPGWVNSKTSRVTGPYGKQRIWVCKARTAEPKAE